MRARRPGRSRECESRAARQRALSTANLHSYGAVMWNPFRRSENAWLETDRREQMRVVLTALGFAFALLAGIGALIYAVME